MTDEIQLTDSEKRTKALRQARIDFKEKAHVHVSRRGQGNHKQTKALHKRLKKSGKFNELALIRATKRCMGKAFYTATPEKQVEFIQKNQEHIEVVKRVILNQLHRDKRLRDKRKAKRTKKKLDSSNPRTISNRSLNNVKE